MSKIKFKLYTTPPYKTISLFTLVFILRYIKGWENLFDLFLYIYVCIYIKCLVLIVDVMNFYLKYIIYTVYSNLNISTKNDFWILNRLKFLQIFEIALYPKIKNFSFILLIFIFITIFKKKKSEYFLSEEELLNRLILMFKDLNNSRSKERRCTWFQFWISTRSGGRGWDKFHYATCR